MNYTVEINKIRLHAHHGMMEQERREAELEKVASEAAKRKSRREAMQRAQEEESDEDALSGLDHYFDKKEG